MLLFNQKYWAQLARKEWLVKGDRNSTYFQRRVNIRRKKCENTKLKDDISIWIDDPLCIRQNFLLNYSERFKSLYRTPRTFLVLGLPSLITQQYNEQLTQLPTMKEIKKAVFEINHNKTPRSNGFSAGFF